MSSKDSERLRHMVEYIRFLLCNVREIGNSKEWGSLRPCRKTL